ncbi:MAG: hypothetical protein ACK42D_04260 [Candidatus Paceibacteria bacterium]
MNAAIATIRFLLPSRKIITTILGIAVLSCVVLYMYLLTMSVVHVVMRKEATQDLRALETEIAALETDFMLAQHVVSTAIVDNQQYTETSEKIFVNRSRSIAVAVSRE